jgi:heme exporter protein D
VSIFQWLTLALSVVNICVIPVIGYLIRQALGRNSDRMERLEARMEQAEADIKATVSEEEWIRESMRLRSDVTEMGKTLARIEGKTDSTLMVATAINRVASAMEHGKGAEGLNAA